MIAFKGMNAMSRLTHALKLGLDMLFPNFCIGCNSHINLTMLYVVIVCKI